MSSKPKMIVLADIAALKISCEGFQELIRNLETKFNVVSCKFYGYVAKRNRDYNEYIASNGFETSLPSASRRRNRLDSRQVIDSADIAAVGKIDAVGIISGDGDILPVVNMFAAKGIDTYDINLVEGKYTYAYTGFIAVPESALRKGYAAPPTRRPASEKPKKSPKPVQQPAPKKENPYVAQSRAVLDGNEVLRRFSR
ncbi:MAG: NYN domain-containing protein [Clostridiales bacterium]|jgi:hypothetical protein|nr:NYN domain-containing protein [Clostridiales bacterium]